MHMSDQLIDTTVTWLKYLGNYSNKSFVNSNNVKINKINKISINFYKKIYKEVGSKYNWISRLKLSDKELKEIIHNKNVEIYLMTVKGFFIGFLEIDYRSLKEIKIGNCMPLSDIPPGTDIHNIELTPNGGGKLARSAGSSAQISGHDGIYSIIKLASGEVRKIQSLCKKERRSPKKNYP